MYWWTEIIQVWDAIKHKLVQYVAEIWFITCITASYTKSHCWLLLLYHKTFIKTATHLSLRSIYFKCYITPSRVIFIIYMVSTELYCTYRFHKIVQRNWPLYFLPVLRLFWIPEISPKGLYRGGRCVCWGKIYSIINNQR